MKFTFKKQPRMTGLMGVGYPWQSVNIKLHKKVVGVIKAPNWTTSDNFWRIAFSVMKTEPDENPNCAWKWVSLSKKFDSEQEARSFIIENFEQLQKQFPFHFQDE